MANFRFLENFRFLTLYLNKNQYFLPINTIIMVTNKFLFKNSRTGTSFLFKNLQEEVYSNSNNSNSIFIALYLHDLKTDSRHIKQKKQKTIIINVRHSKGQQHGEKPVKRRN